MLIFVFFSKLTFNVTLTFDLQLDLDLVVHACFELALVAPPKYASAGRLILLFILLWWIEIAWLNIDSLVVLLAFKQSPLLWAADFKFLKSFTLSESLAQKVFWIR